MSREINRACVAWSFAAMAALALSTACAREPGDAGTATTASDPAVPGASAATAPRMVVHKTPTCGCCSLWVAHLRESGFKVRVTDLDDLGDIRREWKVPPKMA